MAGSDLQGPISARPACPSLHDLEEDAELPLSFSRLEEARMSPGQGREARIGGEGYGYEERDLLMSGLHGSKDTWLRKQANCALVALSIGALALLAAVALTRSGAAEFASDHVSPDAGVAVAKLQSFYRHVDHASGARPPGMEPKEPEKPEEPEQPVRLTFMSVETRGSPLLLRVGNFSGHFPDGVVNIGEGQRWVDYRTKVELLATFLRSRIAAAKKWRLPDSAADKDILVFVDGSDVFWGGCSRFDFLSAYERIVRRSGARIVFSAELACGEQDCNKVPEVPSWAEDLAGGRNLSSGFWKPYATGCKGTWTDECSAKRDCGFKAPCSVPPALKFLNSGFFMGPVKDLADMMEWTLRNYDDVSVWGDQSAFSVYWLDRLDTVTLDYGGELAISLSDMRTDLVQADRQYDVIRNTAFNRVQCAIHANGRGIWYGKEVLSKLTDKEFNDLRGW